MSQCFHFYALLLDYRPYGILRFCPFCILRFIVNSNMYRTDSMRQLSSHLHLRSASLLCLPSQTSLLLLPQHLFVLRLQDSQVTHLEDYPAGSH